MRVSLLASQGIDARERGHLKLAHRYLKRGAMRGDSMSCSALAHMYDTGLGCKPDKKQAMYWYKIAWRSRELIAANNIAILYREVGNHRLAFIWFERAAKNGDGDALVELGKYCLGNSGIARNKAAAIRYLQAAVSFLPYKYPFPITAAGWEEAQSILHDLLPGCRTSGGEDVIAEIGMPC
jgi:TPR repeat protein